MGVCIVRKLCCNCKYLKTHVEPVGPGFGIFYHYCALDGKEVKYGDYCINNKFEAK